MELMKYIIKRKTNRAHLYKSQDFENIKSIENNLDVLIFQKMDMLLNQQKQKKLENRFETPKNNSMRKINANKYNIFNKEKEKINKRITLGKFLMEYSCKKDITNIANKDIDKDDNNNPSENKRVKLKKCPLSFFKRKEIESQKNINNLKKEINNSSNFKIVLNKSDKISIQRKIGKRYTLFKTILNYLESNNITLYELIRNNPFQNKPYEISNSYDFLEAVKFKN